MLSSDTKNAEPIVPRFIMGTLNNCFFPYPESKKAVMVTSKNQHFHF